MSTPVVVLIGPPGAGKTTIGRRIACSLGTTFSDTDELIEEQEHVPCGEVFARLGEPAFRQLEADMVEKALTREGVVALGGGAVTTKKVRNLLQGHPVVWVSVGAEEGYRRTQEAGYRPILASRDPKAHYAEVLAERAPLYQACSEFKVRTDARGPQQVVAAILNWLDDQDD